MRYFLTVLLLILWGCSGRDIDMVLVEGGSFMMGSDHEDSDCDEHPRHEVRVQSFYLGRYEVTQYQWNQVMRKKNPSWFIGENRPVECVSWYDAQLFIQRLNEKTGRKYRLPTEQEWEYAACGGRYGRNALYSGSDNPENIAWFVENADSTTHPVGELQPNRLGIYDMTGNVHEWCSDRYDSLSYSYSEPVEKPCQASDMRVFRGGSWCSRRKYIRIANRNSISAETRNYTLGFRLAEDVDSGD